jgi:hypothetical protein
MNLHEAHIQRLEAANNAVTEHERMLKIRELNAWRSGVASTGTKLDLCAADHHYMDQRIDRPMVAGLWLDWKPSE